MHILSIVLLLPCLVRLISYCKHTNLRKFFTLGTSKHITLGWLQGLVWCYGAAEFYQLPMVDWLSNDRNCIEEAPGHVQLPPLNHQTQA